jgi:hypothetical protein
VEESDSCGQRFGLEVAEVEIGGGARGAEVRVGVWGRGTRRPLRKKLKSEIQIEDARKGGHRRSRKMRHVHISEDLNWLGGG